MTKEERLIKKYEEIAAYIYGYCQKLGCVPAYASKKQVLGLCCDSSLCELIQDNLRSRGIKLKLNPRTGTFVKHNHCIVPPHLRPLCTVHACDRLQCFAGHQFMQKFLRLRNELDQLLIGTKP